MAGGFDLLTGAVRAGPGDILVCLERAGVGDLVETILLHLTVKDLFAAFKVCRDWNCWDTQSFWRRKRNRLNKDEAWLEKNVEDYSSSTDKQKCLIIAQLYNSWNKASAAVHKIDVGSTVLSLCLREDSSSVLVGLNNGTVQEFNIAGAFIREKEIHTKGVKVITMGTNGEILTGSYDGFIGVWDSKLFNIRKIGVGLAVTEILCQAGDKDLGDLYVSGDEGNIWRFNNLHSDSGHPKQVWRIQGGEMINCLALFPKLGYLVSGSDNGDIVVRSCVDGQDIVVLDGHRAATGITALQKDGDYLWSGSFDCSLRYWSSKTWTCLAVLSGHTYPIRSLQVGLHHVMSGDYRGFVMVWEKEEVAREVRAFRSAHGDTQQKEDSLYRMIRGRLVQDRKGIAEVVQHASFLEHSGHVTSIQANAGYLISGSRDRSIVIYKISSSPKQKKSKPPRKNYFDSYA